MASVTGFAHIKTATITLQHEMLLQTKNFIQKIENSSCTITSNCAGRFVKTWP